MVKQVFKNKYGFSFIEVIVVLFIICIIILILSFNPLGTFDRYKERLAVDQIVSDIYLIQTNSIVNNGRNYIQFFEKESTYRIYIDGKFIEKKVLYDGLTGTGDRSLMFKYNNGNVNIANTILVIFPERSYEIIIHLESGYVTVNEK